MRSIYIYDISSLRVNDFILFIYFLQLPCGSVFEIYALQCKVVPVHIMKAYRGISGICPLVLNFGPK